MKKIILMLFLLILSGCKAEYNISYIDNKISESLIILSKEDKVYGEKTFEEIINNYYNDVNLLIDYEADPGDMSESEIITNYKLYNKSIINDKNSYGMKIGYDYEYMSEYNNSTIVHSLYDNLYMSNNVLKTDNIKNIFNYYPYLENIELSFTTDKKVVNTNSDKEIDGVYYWYINKDNYLNKNINIEFEENENNIKIDENGYFSSGIIKYFIMIFAIIILISIVIIYEKVKKSNN